MTNFDLHEQAQQLADTRSAYSLARELLEAKAEARKYKLAGLGMAVSMGDHTCVPEGWQLVPHMPTPEMCAAYRRADEDWADGWAFDDNGNRHEAPVYQWYAMLSAAPKPGEL